MHRHREPILRPVILLLQHRILCGRRDRRQPAPLRCSIRATQEGNGGLQRLLLFNDAASARQRTSKRRLGLAEALDRFIRDRHNTTLGVRPLVAMPPFCTFALTCRHKDPNDGDSLRTSPSLKLTVAHAPPTTKMLVDTIWRGFANPPDTVTVNNSCNPIHSQQHRSLFHTHYGTGDSYPPKSTIFQASSRNTARCGKYGKFTVLEGRLHPQG